MMMMMDECTCIKWKKLKKKMNETQQTIFKSDEIVVVAAVCDDPWSLELLQLSGGLDYDNQNFRPPKI